jgi:uncharacterized protein with PIN domain
MKPKIRVQYDGQPCPNCERPLSRHKRERPAEHPATEEFYVAVWYLCYGCGVMYPDSNSRMYYAEPKFEIDMVETVPGLHGSLAKKQ